MQSDTLKRAELVREITSLPEAEQSKLFTELGQRQINGGNGTQDSGPVDPWKKYRRTMADAMQERPPIVYPVAGIIQRPSLNILYSPPGDFKSWLGMQLALSVAAGVDFLGGRDGKPAPYAVQQCPVIWVDIDQGERTTSDRFKALMRGLRLEPADIPLTYYSFPDPPLRTDLPERVGHLAEWVQFERAGLVIIDNLGNTTGEIDQNAAEMAVPMSHLRWLAETMNIAVVILHHARKGNGNGGRKGDSLRGSSAIEAALDLALIIDREPGSDHAVIQATKVRGAPVRPFGVEWSYQDTEPDTAKRFYSEMILDTTSDAAILQAVIDVLGAGAMNQTELSRAVVDELGGDVGNRRVITVIRTLDKQGKLKTKQGERNAILYYV